MSDSPGTPATTAHALAAVVRRGAVALGLRMSAVRPRRTGGAEGATQLSAHRGGVGSDTASENTRRALEAACRLPCEFVEFDVQRLADGTLVLFHDAHVTIARRPVPVDEIDYATFAHHVPDHLRYVDALAILAGRRKAHIDLKFVSPPSLFGRPDSTWEVAATRAAIAALGADNIIVTTVEDPSVRALRAWAARESPTLLIGLSLGRSVASMGLVDGLRVRLSELFPHRRIRACGANLVVANWILARLTLARYARRHDVPLLVWTVDRARELERWIGRDRAWLVTSNQPLLAAAVRDRVTTPTATRWHPVTVAVPARSLGRRATVPRQRGPLDDVLGAARDALSGVAAHP